MQKYDLIYLSPHLDDAALSCGGQIAQHTAAGKNVLVVTLMAGDAPSVPLSSYAAAMHARWELDETAVATRRLEDQQACAIMRCDFLHWDIPDCIYRYVPNTLNYYYNSDDDIFGKIHPAEAELIDEVAEKLAELPLADQVIAPLTLGNHVDHQITQNAAVQRWPSGLLFYEDYPYAQEPTALSKVIQTPSVWDSMTIPLEPWALEKKFAAVSAYSSQIGMFFKDRADLEDQIGRYALSVGGERLWTRL